MMHDREKIVKAFEECLCKGHDFCSKCYQEGPGLGFVCKNNVCLEVLALLKEQEAEIEKYVKTEFVRLLDDYSDDAFAKESAVEAMTDAFLHYELKRPLKEE